MDETTDIAEKLKQEGKWELVLADDNTKLGREDGVKYLYKRKKI